MAERGSEYFGSSTMAVPKAFDMPCVIRATGTCKSARPGPQAHLLTTRHWACGGVKTLASNGVANLLLWHKALHCVRRTYSAAPMEIGPAGPTLTIRHRRGETRNLSLRTTRG